MVFFNSVTTNVRFNENLFFLFGAVILTRSFRYN